MIHSEKKRRILLMYITKVSGHRAATIAIEKSIKDLLPSAQIMSINGFGYTYPVLEKVVNKAYMSVIKRTPKVWDYLYDNPNIVKGSESIKNFLHKTSHKKLEELFKRFQPDTVICTQAFPCGMVADYKRANNLDTTVIGVLTDYAPHSFWLNEGVDFYVVPSEDAKDRFMSHGIPEESIKVYGIPIRMSFAHKHRKEEIAHQLGLNPNVPILLIMGGGQGLGPIKEVVKSLIKLPRDLQLVVIAGTNKKLIDWLNRLERKRKTDKKIIAYEYANNVDELMEVSTLIVTKPGGMTTAECLAKGLPMVIINPIPGQEMRNTDFLLKHGVAIRIDKTSDIAEEIDLLLNSPHRLTGMSEAARKQGRPNAALNIAKLVIHSAPEATAVS